MIIVRHAGRVAALAIQVHPDSAAVAPLLPVPLTQNPAGLARQ